MRTYADVSAWRRVLQVPMVLRAYIAFALVASVIAMSPLYSPKFNAAIVPYCGWSGLTIYMFTIFFAVAAAQDGQRKSVYAIVLLLAVGIVFGAIDTFWHTLGSRAARPHFDNPHLTYNPFRPLVTMALPTFWSLLLVSPHMKKWIYNS